jgi:hypothetical protein
MDALHNIIVSLSALSHLELMLGLLITATVIIVLEDWRLCIWALAAQYILVAVLLARVMPLPVALVKVIVGGMVCVILYLTARRVHWGRETVAQERYHEPPPVLALWDIFPMNLGFRLFVAVLAAVVSYALASSYPFVDHPEGIAEASYWLVAIGLLTVILTRDPFKVGLGLLTFEAGFEVLFSTFEKSLSVAALLGVINFLIALAIAYLTMAQIQIAVFTEESRR